MRIHWNVKKRLCSTEIYAFMMREKEKERERERERNSEKAKTVEIALFIAELKIDAIWNSLSAPVEFEHRSCVLNEPAVTSAFLMSKNGGSRKMNACFVEENFNNNHF
jgi:hypothetical protein